MIPLMKNAFINEAETRKKLSEFILTAERFSMDQKCREFEIKFAQKQGRKHAILFNSGGSANLALLQALKNLSLLKNNDNVAFSALTWSTNTMPIIQLGMNPVPLDCSRYTLNVMSDNLLERLSDTSLNALFLTNVLGFLGDIQKIKEICNEKNILLIEDNCESLGTEVQEGKAGNFGLAATFSFFIAHHMSTIEGGMVCTDDDELNEMLRIVRANGWDRNLSAVEQSKWRQKFGINSEFIAKYSFYDLAYNLRPTEITGFLGLTQLEYLDQNIDIRERNYLNLRKVIDANEDIIALDHSGFVKLSTFAVPIVCTTKELRQHYLEQFSGAGIEIRPMIAGNMQKQPFYKKYIENEYNLPETDFIHDCGFYCGNYPELTDNNLETIKSCLIKK